MATVNPYDLEQDAFVRQMGGGNTTQGGASGPMASYTVGDDRRGQSAGAGYPGANAGGGAGSSPTAYRTQVMGVPGMTPEQEASTRSSLASLVGTPATGASASPSGNGVEARNALGGYARDMGAAFRQDGYGGDMKAANSMKNTFGRIASR
jgi:hypothetical protein